MPSRLVRVLAAAALASAAVAVPAATAGTPPVLAGENVVTASVPSTMTVRIPAAARIAVDPAKAVSITGGGRFVGLVLREHREEAPDEARFFRLPSQLGNRVIGWGPMNAAPASCKNQLPDPAPPVAQDCTGVKQPTYFSLHRGLYSLYVLTDGAPVTVTLHVLNLPGSTDLAPGTRVGAATVPLTTSFDPATTGGVTWSGGSTLRPTSAADLFTLTWWKQSDSAAASDGACWYGGDDLAALGDKRFLPGCPGGSTVAMTEVTNPLYGPVWTAKGGQHGGLGTTSVPHAATVGLGFWTVAQGIKDAGGIAVWLGH